MKKLIASRNRTTAAEEEGTLYEIRGRRLIVDFHLDDQERFLNGKDYQEKPFEHFRKNYMKRYIADEDQSIDRKDEPLSEFLKRTRKARKNSYEYSEISHLSIHHYSYKRNSPDYIVVEDADFMNVCERCCNCKVKFKNQNAYYILLHTYGIYNCY